MQQFFCKNISSDKSHDLIGHREKGNQTKAFSYINAFSESCLPSQLIKWVTNQTVTGGKISKPNVSTPVALLGKLSWYLCTCTYLPFQLRLSTSCNIFVWWWFSISPCQNMATQLSCDYKSGARKLPDHPSPFWSMAVHLQWIIHPVIIKWTKVGNALPFFSFFLLLAFHIF